MFDLLFDVGAEVDRADLFSKKIDVFEPLIGIAFMVRVAVYPKQSPLSLSTEFSFDLVRYFSEKFS